MRNLLSFADNEADAVEQEASPDITSVSDQRLIELKKGIVKDEEREKSLKLSTMVVRVSKRVRLAELTIRYMEENEVKKATPKRRPDREISRVSAMERFTDLFFPETKKFKKGKFISKKERQLSKKKRECPREAAKRRVEYWIQLGKPLMKMVQRFGYGILLLLPGDITD